MNKEIRLNSEKFSVRSEGTNEFIEGYGSIFNSRSNLISENGKIFIEVIREGAFDFALQRKDLNVLAVLNHERKNMLARTKSGTLILEVDERGLKYSFSIPATTLGNDVKEMLERGDIDASSFKYSVRPKYIKWSRDENGTLVREILRVERLMDVSLVIDPAFDGADVALSSREYDEFEAALSLAEEVKERELSLYYNNIRNAFYKN